MTSYLALRKIIGQEHLLISEILQKLENSNVPVINLVDSIAFFAHLLTDSKENFTTTEKELIAISFALNSEGHLFRSLNKTVEIFAKH
jgi:RNase H-like domain found in reverse transcriptase